VPLFLWGQPALLLGFAQTYLPNSTKLSPFNLHHHVHHPAQRLKDINASLPFVRRHLRYFLRFSTAVSANAKPQNPPSSSALPDQQITPSEPTTNKPSCGTRSTRRRLRRQPSTCFSNHKGTQRLCTSISAEVAHHDLRHSTATNHVSNQKAARIVQQLRQSFTHPISTVVRIRTGFMACLVEIPGGVAACLLRMVTHSDFGTTAGCQTIL